MKYGCLSAFILAMVFSCQAIAQDFTFYEAPRYITHVARQGGGFKSSLILNNGASTSKMISVQPIADSGEYLFPVLQITLQARSIDEISVHEVFPVNTSHLLISGSRRILVSVRYDSEGGQEGLQTHLHESSLTDNRYQVYSGTPVGGSYWEGAAIVNLIPNFPGEGPPIEPQDSEVLVQLKNKQNELLGEYRFPLANSAKALKVFGEIFPQIENLAHNSYYYEISSSAPLGVTALMGNLERNDIASAHPAAPLQADEVIQGNLNSLNPPSYTLVDVSLHDDILTMHVNYDGSCLFTPTLIWSGNFMESNPVQTEVQFTLLGKNPLCLGIAVSRELEFDLGLINRELMGGDGKPDPIILHILDQKGERFDTVVLNGDPLVEE